MTFREKLQKEHPEIENVNEADFCVGCPFEYGYESVENINEICSAMSCVNCWGREIPESDKSSANEVVMQNENSSEQHKLEYSSEMVPPKALLLVSHICWEDANIEYNYRKISAKEHIGYTITHLLAWLAENEDNERLAYACLHALFALELEIEKQG